VASHDGFTLADIVSYDGRHNEANGEDGNDGHSENFSHNWGAEGPTDDPQILETRGRVQRALLGSAMLSDGTPMLLAGDEFGNSQEGNNNAYCQDNEISWFDWDSVDTDLLAFTRRLIEIRTQHPVFRRRRWFKGLSPRDGVIPDIAWLRPDGGEMAEDDWRNEHAKSFAVFLNGDALRDVDDDGQEICDDSFLLLFNAHHESRAFTMPAPSFGTTWRRVVDTSCGTYDDPPEFLAGSTLDVPERTVVVLARAVMGDA
jgi:glycogen operon protein